MIIEHETFTCPIHQGYIEPHTGTAMWNNDGTLTIWSSSQGHFNVRDQTARLLNVPVSMVRAIPMEIGGGFGGKTIVYVEPVAAALARKAGRPVKVTMARTDVFEATGPTSGTHVRVKLGATRDGRLVAGEAHLIYEAGAFPGSPMPCTIKEEPNSDRIEFDSGDPLARSAPQALHPECRPRTCTRAREPGDTSGRKLCNQHPYRAE